MAAPSGALTTEELARWGEGLDYLRASAVWLDAVHSHYRTRLPTGDRQDWDGLVQGIRGQLAQGVSILEQAWSAGKKREAYNALEPYVQRTRTQLEQVRGWLARRQQSLEGRLWTSYADLRETAGRVVKSAAIGIAVAAVAGLWLLGKFIGR